LRRGIAILVGGIAVVASGGCSGVLGVPATGDTLWTREFAFSDVPPDSAGGREARATELYRELDRLEREGGPSPANERIVETLTDPDELEIGAIWLRDHYMYGSAPDALYGLFYFDALIALNRNARNDLFGPSLQDTMVMMVYVSSELLAHENVARCAEQPNGTNYRLYWKTARRRGPFAREIWDKMTVERRNFALRFAKARVESAEGRPPSPNACAAGMQAMQAAMDAGLCKTTPGSDLPSDFVDGHLGGSKASFMLCDSARFATFVDDATWAARRESVRAQYWSALFTD